MVKKQIWFTMGPKTEKPDDIAKALKAGATGVRLTFSYSTPECQHIRARLIRSISKELKRPVFILADLQGGKCRIDSSFESVEIWVEKGQIIELCDVKSKPSILTRIPLQGDFFLKQIAIGDLIIEGDGGVMLKVLELHNNKALCEVCSDGIIHRGRGLTAQSSNFRPEALTQKDISDLAEITKQGDLYDAVAVSFVSSAEDVLATKRILDEHHVSLKILAKIETALGLKNIDAIAQVTDMIMVARGDLALALPWVDLYGATQQIIQSSKRNNVSVIVATQLMEGLERFMIPTRAEMSDLAHWISEGADGAMLSYETAFGLKPFEAIRCSRMIVDRYAICSQTDKFISGRQGYGLIQLYHGYGKGKTTAGLGLAIRAAGAGKKVIIIYFDKGGSEHYSERAILDKIENIDYIVTGRDRINEGGLFDFTITDEDKLEARRGLDVARAALAGEYDLVILDEINSTIALELLDVVEVVELIKNKNDKTEVVLTGRNPVPELVQIAHLITDMKPQKHYFDSGIKAREGLDY